MAAATKLPMSLAVLRLAIRSTIFCGEFGRTTKDYDLDGFVTWALRGPPKQGSRSLPSSPGQGAFAVPVSRRRSDRAADHRREAADHCGDGCRPSALARTDAAGEGARPY